MIPPSLAVSYQLHADRKAGGAHVTDDVVLACERAEAALEMRSDGRRAGDEILEIDYIEHGLAGSAQYHSN